jgi:hypothetical protein
MDALEAAFDVWKHLASPWHKYFKKYFGIQRLLNAQAFRLSMDIVKKNCRAAPGFEDFASDIAKGVEPGSPSSSFLYHAFASSSVQPPGLDDSQYLTDVELEIIENYVFAKAQISVRDLVQLVNGQPLAIGVFTKQYRNISETAHKQHADLVFSRTGVARVGNEREIWNGRFRCYQSCISGAEGMAVLPCRYSAWIATKVSGNPKKSIPGRFQSGDDSLGFWVPVHKIFSGKDCLAGVSIDLRFSHGHRNEKLRKVHRALQFMGYGSHHAEPEIDAAPFVETNLLHSFETTPHSCLVVPQDKIVEEVVVGQGSGAQPVTMFVPPNVRDEDSSFHIIPRPQRWAPEFVYVRDAVVGGARIDLIAEFDISAFVRRGGFDAVHYRDFTGDGWVRAVCDELSVAIPLTLPAYSILAPLDLVPNVRQADLMDWYNNVAPVEIKSNLWVGSSPVPLCDVRDAANISLPESGFVISDVTVSALVGLATSPAAGSQPVVRLPAIDDSQTTSLPDDASGIFAPGSEIGEDQTAQIAAEDGTVNPSTSFFSNYGMGSPFLEDTKLCAAQSAFWPGTSPDTSRVYEPHSQPSVTPLTDEEIPWDGSPLPILIAGQQKVRHRSRAHTDYIRHAKFNFGLLANLSIEEYVERTVAMARVYQMLGAATLFDKSQWVVLRFGLAPQKGPASPPRNIGRCYFLEMYRYTGYSPDPPGAQPVTTFLVSFDELIRVFANSSQVLLERNGHWEHKQF